MRIDNARKTWGHSGQLDVYWLPAPVLNFVTENMDLKCVPKSRQMNSKKIACSKCKVKSIGWVVKLSHHKQKASPSSWMWRVSPESTDTGIWATKGHQIQCFSRTSFSHTMRYKKCSFTTNTWKIERWGWTSVSHSVQKMSMNKA